jgi:hypothetical protein
MAGLARMPIFLLPRTSRSFGVSSLFLRRAELTPEYVQEAKNDGYAIVHSCVMVHMLIAPPKEVSTPRFLIYRRGLSPVSSGQ